MDKSLSHVTTTSEKREEKFKNENTQKRKILYTSKEFYGARMNTGAAKLICGTDQASALIKRTDRTLQLKHLFSRFRFRDFIYNIKGIIDIQIPVNINGFTKFKYDMETVDIPILLHSKDLKKKDIVLIYLEDRVKHKPTDRYEPSGNKQTWLFCLRMELF